MSSIGISHLRIARPTDNIVPLRHFYCVGLGFKVLYEFQGHDGFDGLMLGHESAAYHLEFTRKEGHFAGRAPTPENLLVFYLPDKEVWNTTVAKMQAVGYDPVKAFNPYWDRDGKTFVDPDGYRVVLQHAAWTNEPL